MKTLFFLALNILICLTINAQNTDNFDKIKTDYFKKYSSYDTSNVYLIIDKGEYEFCYSDKYLGAYDENFDLKLNRHFRLKVNKASNIKQYEFPLFKGKGIIKESDFVIYHITSYNIENNKIVKNNISKDNIKYIKKDSTITLDLNSLNLMDNSIIDIEFNICNLPKKQISWNLDRSCFIINSQLTARIPQIYMYDFTLFNPNKCKVLEDTTMSYGTTIGYRYNNSKLMSRAFYNAYKQKNPSAPMANEVECKNKQYSFNANNIMPFNNDIKTEIKIDFILLNIEPIN